MTERKSYHRQATIILKNEVTCQIVGLLPLDVEVLFEQYGIFVPNFKHMQKYQLGIWDGKSHFFTKNATTYTYLLSEIIPFLKQNKYKITIEDRRSADVYEPILIKSDHFSHIKSAKTGEPYSMRNYQVESVNAVTEHGNGVIVAATSAGKTIINAALVDAYRDLRSITIVPITSLVTQTYKQFVELGLDAGRLVSGFEETSAQHLISTWQSLQNRPHVLRDRQVLVVDECHGASANTIKKLTHENGSHIAYRFGLTGSFPKEEAYALAINVSLGPIRYEIPAEALIAAGWLAKPSITIYQLDDIAHLASYDDDNEKALITYESETSFLQTCKERIQWIADLIDACSVDEKGNTLCLVNSVPVGKKLAKLVPDAIFVYGKNEEDDRQRVYDLFEHNDGLRVIATRKVAGVGVSIDRIFKVITVDLGKSFTATIQALGRGLRKGRDKDSVKIYDVCSNLSHSTRHMKKRMRYYKEAKYPYKHKLVKYD